MKAFVPVISIGGPSTSLPHSNGSYTTSETENEHRSEGQKGALFVLPLTVR